MSDPLGPPVVLPDPPELRSLLRRSVSAHTPPELEAWVDFLTNDLAMFGGQTHPADGLVLNMSLSYLRAERQAGTHDMRDEARNFMRLRYRDLIAAMVPDPAIRERVATGFARLQKFD